MFDKHLLNCIYTAEQKESNRIRNAPNVAKFALCVFIALSPRQLVVDISKYCIHPIHLISITDKLEKTDEVLTYN